MNKPFQTKLKELREAAGYKSQQAFADAFGVAQSTVGGWEAGKREPNFETTIKLANFFNVPIDQLLGNDDFVFSREALKEIGRKIELASKDLDQSPEECLSRLFISAHDVRRMVGGEYPFTSSTLAQVANFLKKPMDYFLPGYTKKAPVLTEKDKRDISRDLERIMEDLEGSGDLMFDGVPMSQEAIDSLKSAMKLGLEAVKLRNKETYTPKKYRRPKKEE